jgi:hypothetical protein
MASGDRTLHITKLSAAENQFRRAVRLHFGGADPVSALTLAAAACEILRGVAQHRGVYHPFHDELLPLVPPSKKTKFFHLLKAPQNFLKHARDDPQESIALNPEFTELLLFEAARAYYRLVGYETPEAYAVFMWVCLKHPDIVVDEHFKTLVTSPLARSISFDHPDALLAWIDAMRAEHGDRLPIRSGPQSG